MSEAARIAGVYRRPFPEQVAYFRNKLGNLVPTRRWDDMLGAAHDQGFMVAGAMQADLLTDLAAAVDKAIAEGHGIEEFRKDFRAIVKKNGWTGWTGEGSVRGEAWRVKTILRTNAYTSYAAGRYAQLVSRNFKYWVYSHGGSAEPREQHLFEWNGLALPPDHPFWQKAYPPSDWGCSCYVNGTNSEAGIRRLGGDPNKTLRGDWDAPDPKTGAPAGIGRGWDYAPGASVVEIIRAMAAKVGSWDFGVARAFLAALPVERQEALSSAHRNLPSTAANAERAARRAFDGEVSADNPQVTSLAMVPRSQLDDLGEQMGRPLPPADFRYTDQAMAHVRNDHTDSTIEASRGQRAAVPADFALLPRILEEPDSIVVQKGRTKAGETVAVYSKRIGRETFHAVMAISRRRVANLTLKTFYVGVEGKAPRQRP